MSAPVIACSCSTSPQVRNRQPHREATCGGNSTGTLAFHKAALVGSSHHKPEAVQGAPRSLRARGQSSSSKPTRGSGGRAHKSGLSPASAVRPPWHEKQTRSGRDTSRTAYNLTARRCPGSYHMRQLLHENPVQRTASRFWVVVGDPIQSSLVSGLNVMRACSALCPVHI